MTEPDSLPALEREVRAYAAESADPILRRHLTAVLAELDRVRGALAQRLDPIETALEAQMGVAEEKVRQPLSLGDIAAALEKTLANHMLGEHGYYSPDRVGDGWLDTQINYMARALFDDGWTPPVVLPVAVERGQR